MTPDLMSEGDKSGISAIKMEVLVLLIVLKKCYSRNDNICPRKINEHYTCSTQKQPL
jgi:hypothetical protein